MDNVIFSPIRCKFVQTDAMGDEMVQLQIINTLRNIVRSSTSQFLSDETAWDIISSSHNILLHTAATGLFEFL